MKEWQDQRNRYLKKWREMDVSEFPEETQRLLWGSADRSIRHNMTPDDLAAVLKESRGVEILKSNGEPFRHLDGEWEDAYDSLKKTIGTRKPRTQSWGGLRGRIQEVQLTRQPNTEEIALLEEKLSDLSNLLDKYKDAMRKYK